MGHSGRFRWRDNLPSPEWDHLVGRLNGHPLQSAAWGDARRLADGIEDVRLAAFLGDEPVLLARVELRPVLRWWSVGWVPRGPAAVDHPAALEAAMELRTRCCEAGCSLLVVDPYRPHAARIGELGWQVGARPRTICLDLTRGRQQLLADLDRQWRYNMNLAQRKGVVVEQTQDEEDIRIFFGLCRRLAKTKMFEFGGSLQLMRHLVASSHSGPVRWRLFVARRSNQLAGGGIVAVSGCAIHQVWSAVNRDYRRERPGEAVHWAAIEWALQEGLELYDLEGIDPQHNPGTYDFKRRMGGSEITLPGKFVIPITRLGHLGAWFLGFTLGG